MKDINLFSKALFKQSCKANGVMWAIITVAVCFMLACVMLISGTSSLSSMKENVEDTVIKESITASVKKNAIAEYIKSNDACEIFDSEFTKKFNELNTLDTYNSSGSSSFQETYVTPAYNYALDKVKERYDSLSSAYVTINPNILTNAIYKEYGEEVPEDYKSALVAYMKADVDSVSKGETATALSDYIKSKERVSFRENRAYNTTSMLVAGQMNKESTINSMLDFLSDYGITREKYDAMGFTYDYVHKVSYEASLEYQEKLTYETSLLASTLSTEEYEAKVNEIKEELNLSVAGSLLDKLPEDVASGIEEIGQMDLYGLIVGSIFFKMAGLLLPIIYLIMSANNLIAGQVDSGSMAYVLSTSTKRRQVTFTQGLYLVLSLLLMFICTTITSIVCYEIVDVQTKLTISKLILINLGAFMVMFALSGINFFASCYYDRSKRAMSIGGGLSMFFLVATMLGLFGSSVIPSVVRISALNYFNYVSLITLFDVVSILKGTTTWIWKLAILVAIGLVGYILGDIKFRKKDLPL